MVGKKSSMKLVQGLCKSTVLAGVIAATTVFGGASSALMLGAVPAVAEAADTLSISGLVPSSNNELVKLSRDDLAKIAPTSFVTTTIWTEGSQAFEGSSLKGLLDHLGVKSGTIVARVVNDYSVNIPVGDIEAGGPIVA